jgi:salicylate hydroxylase
MRTAGIVLIGGGIGGLTAALALLRRGFRVTVHEQAPELREVGAGLSVTPNAAHVLVDLGLGELLRTRAMALPRTGVKHFRTGRLLVDIPRGPLMLEKYGEHYYVIHRADLHEGLAAAITALDSECIRVGQRCIGVTQDEVGIAARFDNGTEARGDVLIGCDGLRSVVRECVHGAAKPPFAGYIAYRALVPTERIRDVVIEPPSCLQIGPGHSFTRYPVRNGQLLNYVAMAERGGWEVESWSVRADVGEVLEEFREFEADVRRIIAATPPDTCFKWALLDREPLASWARGRVTLLGDAAHPMLPFLGQGAVMAIEDGMVLARAFEASGDWREALHRYESARRERTTFVMQMSREAVKRYHAPNTDAYDKTTHQAGDALGLFAYNPVTVAV